jgi:transposase, IS5 family
LKIEKEDSAMRNAIEVRFSTAKRRYGMNRIMTKLQRTSETSIAMIVLVMNLEKMLRDIFPLVALWSAGAINQYFFKEKLAL